MMQVQRSFVGWKYNNSSIGGTCHRLQCCCWFIDFFLENALKFVTKSTFNWTFWDFTSHKMITPPKTNSSPMKIGHPKKEMHLPTIHFQVRTVSFTDERSSQRMWYCWWKKSHSQPPFGCKNTLWIMGFQLPFPQLVFRKLVNLGDFVRIATMAKSPCFTTYFRGGRFPVCFMYFGPNISERVAYPRLGGGNSNILGIFTPIWERFPIWLLFFRWVETTNQKGMNDVGI